MRRHYHHDHPMLLELRLATAYSAQLAWASARRRQFLVWVAVRLRELQVVVGPRTQEVRGMSYRELAQAVTRPWP